MEGALEFPLQEEKLEEQCKEGKEGKHMDRELTNIEIEGLEDLLSHPGYRVVLEELKLHLEQLVEGSRKAKSWDEHNVREAQATLLEEIIELIPTMLREEERYREEKKLEEKEE